MAKEFRELLEGNFWAFAVAFAVKIPLFISFLAAYKNAGNQFLCQLGFLKKFKGFFVAIPSFHAGF